ncbi:iron-siderophore ABC transporter substrate-binding protein [Actinobacteria bacterium YIM 96077]|uniref:Iron-siderophore ABC transporter substrate-binding protein n=1 Tax=Phytoactinopolyspora halophila TaxID=1981511 RepID=A0A329R2T4_9ACTN|nr:iron-siderophore ABC transporter substrate-binding protein [Phytoactinopolyspora halophila]AYY11877.1 iron-siderophore ABC transporter substrate-binding protein [Actinobacteria bacterium YIM 96077]RAW18890.1 iron-siderophore ABC transporter substrate-binding protein [Phytoactinopolyspora halophila]
MIALGKTRPFAPAVLSAALLLAACGSSEDTSDDTATTEDGGSGSSGSISVETNHGPVELDEPATTVVALEWSFAENLVALGIQPAGVADVEGYSQWVSAGPELGEDVVDVGTRQEPSLDQIEALEPDLILTDDDRSVVNIEELQDIAPTYSSDFYGHEGGQLQAMRDIFQDTAVLTGTEDAADEIMADFDARMEAFEKALDSADAAGEPFLLAQGFTYEGAATVRIFGKPTFASELLEAAGMENGWPGDTDEYGLTDTDVEGLTQADPASSLIYVAQEDDNIFTEELADNPIYQGLEFVEEDRVHPIDPGTWLWGGPVTAITVYDEVQAALGL